jgi:RNA polymerase sigma-70 factor (ECF subfamily)
MLAELSPTPLADALLVHAAAPAPSDRAGLEARLADIVHRAAAAWPGVTVSPADFMAHLAQRLGKDAAMDEALDSLQTSDLYLACATWAGQPAAIAAFERTFLREVPAMVARIDAQPAFGDEVTQALRERLLVPDAKGGVNRMGDYSGAGPLGGWVRVAAVRTALNLKRAVRREAGSEREHGLEVRAPELDPELDYIKIRYAPAFRDAFRQTLAELALEDRTMMRMHYLDGMTIDEIGLLYRVHRATVARRIARARDAVAHHTYRLLRERLAVGESELASLLHLVRSQLDVSLATYMK